MWAERWLVKFNPAAPEAILIPRKTNKPYHPLLKMNDELIQEVSTRSHKHLGIFFSMMELGINTFTIKKEFQRFIVMRQFYFSYKQVQ